MWQPDRKPAIVNLNGRERSARIVGPPWAVVTLTALLGMIVLAVLAMQLARDALRTPTRGDQSGERFIEPTGTGTNPGRE